ELAKYYEHREKNYAMALECTRAARDVEDSASLENRQRRLEIRCLRTARQATLLGRRPVFRRKLAARLQRQFKLGLGLPASRWGTSQGELMTNLDLILIAIVILAIAFAAVMYIQRQRTKRLRGNFGPEYDRMVRERGNQWKAEHELAARERRVEKLH